MVEKFRLRWNNYERSQKIPSEGGTPKQKCFHQPFLSKNHHELLEDCQIWLVDTIDLSDPAKRDFAWKSLKS